MYDVLVIGAGPAGCTAAKTLAEQGLKVLLVEKFPLPRAKSCSGVLIRKSMELTRRYFGESVPASVTCSPAENRGMIFTDDAGREIRFEQEGLNVWRSGFDGWLASAAAASGACLRDATTVLSWSQEPNCVSITMRGKNVSTEKARYVLNCEGVVGALKRKLTGSPRDYIITFQTFNEGSINLDPHYFYAYLQPALSEYDAWFNVKDDMLVLGVSVRTMDSIVPCQKRFYEYMRVHHNLRIQREIRAEKWLMPHIKPGCALTLGQGRILFAGEVAGFLNPMGEGISAGMESGYCAAQAILSRFESPDAVLAEYRQAVAPLKAYMERQWDFVAKMAAPFAQMRRPQ